MKASEVCHGLDCSKCPIRDLACIVAEEEMEKEMLKEAWNAVE
jgi:hypothetical protein